jgi:hypothetical protein
MALYVQLVTDDGASPKKRVKEIWLCGLCEEALRHITPKGVLLDDCLPCHLEMERQRAQEDFLAKMGDYIETLQMCHRTGGTVEVFRAMSERLAALVERGEAAAANVMNVD